MRENIQDKLDEIEAASAADVKQNATQVLTKGVEQSIVEIKNEISSIDSAVNSLHTEIHGYEDNKMNAATVVEHKANIARQFEIINEELKLLIQAKLALPQESTDADYSDQMIRDKYAAMSLKWKNKLNNLYMVLARKALNSEVIEPKLTACHADLNTSLETFVQKRELVHLEKTKPPRFDGTELEFPEFRRKWLAQVNKASLPEESELDKLREAVPRQAKDMLYGVTSLTEAQKILTHRYGNPDLISKKLKDQLKNVVCEGSNDPEKLMDLRIKVKNVVTRLETMELSADLTHDREFLSAVYNAMPQRYKTKWLDLTKSKDKWADMISFLDSSYEKAIEELSLLSSISSNSKKVKPCGISADSSGNSSSDKDRYEKAKNAAGKCPICKEFHTFKRNIGRDSGKLWPSDRFVSCRKF